MSSIVGREPNKADLSTYRGRFAANLRKLRLAKFESQEDFAKALKRNGVAVAVITVSSWERGKSVPALDFWPGIARTLEKTAAELLPAR